MPPHEQARRIRLRFAGRCCSCDVPLAADTWAVRLRTARAIECLSCAAVHRRLTTAQEWRVAAAGPADPVGSVVGDAGASAAREHGRRRRGRVDRILAAHPRFGTRLVAMTDEPRSIRAWAIGATGERRLGRVLDSLADRGVRVLHDRRVPRSRANIDHIAVTPSGVHVIDAKRYGGRVRLHARGPVHRLLVDSRDHTELIAGVHWQVDVVRATIARHGDDVPVTGSLCFVGADWPATGDAFTLGGVRVLSPASATTELTTPGPLDADRVRALHSALAATLDPA